MKLCAGPKCRRPAKTKGLCNSHYVQMIRGRPLTPLLDYHRPRMGRALICLPADVLAVVKADPAGARAVLTRRAKRTRTDVK